MLKSIILITIFYFENMAMLHIPLATHLHYGGWFQHNLSNMSIANQHKYDLTLHN